MKITVLLSLMLGLGALNAAAQGAAGVIVKQRAKELVNQSDVRQGVPSPAQPAKPAPPQTPGQTPPSGATLKQQNIARLQTDLAAIAGKGQASPELKQRFTKNLLAGVQGPGKPSGDTVAGFVDNLSGVLAGQSLESAERARLAQNLNAICYSSSLAATRVDAILSDVQAILQVAGVKRSEAVRVVADLRAMASEIRRAPAR